MNLSVPQNVNLPPPLMSRFDLLYLILDKPNEQDDRRLAQHLVSLYLTERPQMSENDFLVKCYPPLFPKSQITAH